ncbi:MAG TPA: RNA-binding cell elongation regulator Jag/EloR [Acidimicrobiales bacterium]|nr:RNA-binding cell elongation regulator Jag/EloR [Acidimicrobiales bacterium]
MEWVETTGRTVDEAKEAALDQLGVADEDAEFQVLEEPKPGLFGRVRGEARVRARVRPTQPRPKEDRRDRRRRQRAGETAARSSEGRPQDEPDESLPPEPTERPRRVDAGSARPATAARAALVVEDAEDDDDAEEPKGMEMEREVSLEEQASEASGFVKGLVDQLQLEAQVDFEILDEENVEIRVNGPDLGFLIGPRGTTLAAVQELTRTVVQRHTGARHGRILVDVAGYRQKRKAALERFTAEVAAQVKASGERRVLEPMSPADRKIVHDTANGIDGVSTTSEGEEPRRRVVILPQS